ncbi:hypothetical protein ACTQ1U_01405 [Thermoguttaceae bacterium LCP21S3_D4]
MMVPVEASIKRALGADNATGADATGADAPGAASGVEASGVEASGMEVSGAASGDGLSDSVGVSFSVRTGKDAVIGVKVGLRRDRLMKIERMVCIRIPPVCSITF